MTYYPLPDLDNLSKYVDSQFNREFLLISLIFVAGKTATFGNNKTEAFVNKLYHITTYYISIHEDPCPIKNLSKLYDTLGQKEFTILIDKILRETKTGKYKLLTKAMEFLATANLDLQKCTVEELLGPGIGFKSAKLFLMTTRREAHAAIDVHVVKFLMSEGYLTARPKNLASRAIYERLEGYILEEAKKRNMTPFEFDQWVRDNYKDRPWTSL